MVKNQGSGALPLDQAEVEQQNLKHKLLFIANSLPHFRALDDPKPLSGGLLYFVWRIYGQPGSKPTSLIAKWAAPFIASSPDVQLDPSRIRIEAKVLEAFGPEGPLNFLSSEKIRPPQLYKFVPSENLLFMEDVCQCPDLSDWIMNPHNESDLSRIGTCLGDFVGKMHRACYHRPDFSQMFDNATIQHTRLEVQYNNVGNYARKAHHPKNHQIGQVAISFGELLQKIGKVLIMGDLWLPSIFVSDNKLRIIDWELAHFGRPSQDIGHLAAHLWMFMHRYRGQNPENNARTILDGFLKGYRAALSKMFEQVFGLDGVRESAIHFGSEVLTRTVGNFQNGYLYEGLPWDHPLIQEAVACAAKHILDPLEQSTFDGLNWRNT